MDEQHSLLLVVVRFVESLRNVFQLNDLSSVAARGFQVVARSAAMGQDDGTASEHFAGISYRLCMIAAADGNNTRASCMIKFKKDLVERTTYFERAGGL